VGGLRLAFEQLVLRHRTVALWPHLAPLPEYQGRIPTEARNRTSDSLGDSTSGGGLIGWAERDMIPTMQLPRDKNRRRLGFAREMRKLPTDAEAKLWRALRLKRLAGYRFRRQHPVGGYILDFYCPACRLAVELDGGQHADPAQMEYDRTRSVRLAEMGIRVVRFWDTDALKDTLLVAEEILRHLEASPPPPQPSPGVPGAGEMRARTA
jgi:very-short-patch-repair endonuclease